MFLNSLLQNGDASTTTVASTGPAIGNVGGIEAAKLMVRGAYIGHMASTIILAIIIAGLLFYAALRLGFYFFRDEANGGKNKKRLITELVVAALFVIVAGVIMGVLNNKVFPDMLAQAFALGGVKDFKPAEATSVELPKQWTNGDKSALDELTKWIKTVSSKITTVTVSAN